MSVNCNIILNYSQQAATIFLFIYFYRILHVSGGSSAHHQEHITAHTASGIVNQYCCYCYCWTERLYTPHNLHSSVSTYSGHQPAATWVNTTRYCKYSQVLLMMGENIDRNM